MDSAKADYLAAVISASANFPLYSGNSSDLHLFLVQSWGVKNQIKMLKYDCQ